MKQLITLLSVVFIFAVFSGCTLPDFSEPSVAPAPADRSSFLDGEDGVEMPESTDVTAINRFLKSFNMAVPESLQMVEYEVEHNQALDAFFVGNGTYRLVFRLEESGEVQSVFYQDGLSREDQKTVSMALVSVLASEDGGLGSLKDEAKEKRKENDGFTQNLVDAIDDFGNVGVPDSGTPQVSLEDSELKMPETFTQDDLQTPEVEAPTGSAVPKNPNEPDLPEIGNFGKMPE